MKWVKIKDFTNYSVSEYGDVRNDKTGRILKQRYTANDYVQYRLSKNGEVHQFYSHRLVAKHFLSKVEGKEFVNHIDENKKNNHFSNLEWCTTKENINHGTRTERSAKTCSKEVEQYDLQGNLLNVFCSTSKASRSTGINLGNISSCCSGRYKSAGGYVWKYTN